MNSRKNRVKFGGSQDSKYQYRWKYRGLDFIRTLILKEILKFFIEFDGKRWKLFYNVDE